MSEPFWSPGWRVSVGSFIFRSAKERIMAKANWGLCKDCKWWQIEPGAKVANTTMGLCIDEDLQKFQLRVSGNSGCNRFMPGKPAHAKGSGAAPPTASPTR
jgi:hypothetical protein